jgi:hypothetical protein
MAQQSTLEWFKTQKTDKKALDSLNSIQISVARSLRIRSRSCMTQNADIISLAHYIAAATDNVANLSNLVMVLSQIVLACDKEKAFDSEALVEYQPFVSQLKEQAGETALRTADSRPA